MPALERDELDRIEQSIIEVMEKASPRSPRAVLDELSAQGFDENLVRAAIWFLVDRRQLDFSPQRELVIVHSLAARNGRTS